MITIEDEVAITNKLSQWKNGLRHDAFKGKSKKTVIRGGLFCLVLSVGMYLIFKDIEYIALAIISAIGIIIIHLIYNEEEWYVDKDGIYILAYQPNNCKNLKSIQIHRWDDLTELTIKQDFSADNPEREYRLIIRKKDGSREILNPPVNQSTLKEILPKYIYDASWFKGL